MESSVEELIAAPVLSSFRADGESERRWAALNWTIEQSRTCRDDLNPFCVVTGFNFSSSGREDVDVRTLGNGENALFSFLKLRLQIILSPEGVKNGNVKKCFYFLFWFNRQVVRLRWSC